MSLAQLTSYLSRHKDERIKVTKNGVSFGGVEVYAEGRTPPASGRRCGSCTLCCTLLPVIELKKGSNERCRHARGGGCRIYHEPHMPRSCKVWSCRWLIDGTVELPRPDASSCVIDPVPDIVFVQEEPDAEPHEVLVFQIWVDPAYPDAWRTPEMMAWMTRMAKDHGAPFIVRKSHEPEDALFVAPGSISLDGEWIEKSNRSMVEFVSSDP